MAEKENRDNHKHALPRPEHPRLIVLEGIDLSGRTTQVQLLQDWLQSQHCSVTPTAWRTSPLVSDILARARLGPPLQALTYSLLFCADHMDRTQQVIRPALERGEIVLADRYTYTAFARDAARGLDRDWVRNLYRFSAPPDIVFYLHITPEEAVKRRVALQQRAASKKNEKEAKGEKHERKHEKEHAKTGTLMLSTSLSNEALESFRNFEIKMYSEYQHMQKEFGFCVIEGNQSIDSIQTELRHAIVRLLSDRG